jgi:hypothetical protein
MEIKNKGVEILLSRMESNPEEFELGYYGNSKRWDWVLKGVLARIERKHKSTIDHPLDLPYLSDAEVNALHQKYMSIQGDSFTKRVMGELLSERDPIENSLAYQHPYNKTDDSDQRKMMVEQVKTKLEQMRAEQALDSFVYNTHGRLVFKDNE